MSRSVVNYNTNSMMDAVYNMVKVSLEKDDLVVTVSLGQIYGKYVKKLVKLPIQGGPVVLENNNSYDFLESLPVKTFNKVATLFEKSHENTEDSKYEIDVSDKSYTDHFFFDKTAHVIQGTDKVQATMNETCIGSQTIYIPDSEFHLKLDLLVRPPAPEFSKESLDNDPKIAPTRFRTLRVFHYCLKNEEPPAAASTGKRDGKKSKKKMREFYVLFVQNRQVSEDDETEEETFNVKINFSVPYMKSIANDGNALLDYLTEAISAGRKLAQMCRKTELKKLVVDSDDSEDSSEEDSRKADSDYDSEGEKEEFFFPNFIGDVASNAKKHYDEKKNLGAKGTELEGLRKCNNEVKRLLIELYVPKTGAKVLDLACGHGQDMLKYVEKEIQLLIGIDISAVEIKLALSRYMEQLASRNIRFRVDYRSGDLLLAKTYEFLKGELFDIVSIQLAMHYLMISIDSCRSFLSQVSKHLQAGGFFLGTTASHLTISGRLCEDGKVKVDSNGNYFFGNDYYRVSFAPSAICKLLDVPSLQDARISVDDTTKIVSFTPIQKERMCYSIENRWGIGYTFWLKDLISDAFEYNIPWSQFLSVAKNEFQLDLVEDINFLDAISVGSAFSPRLKEWFDQKMKSGLLKDYEKDPFSFYKAFVFRKQGGELYGSQLNEAARRGGELYYEKDEAPTVVRKRKRVIKMDNF
eukprot:GDKJ01049513.1.p1 GENE.GDKJ01049513.1~~GDKJ01049513.1.p1  ORF type:complete len:692 (+),score=176.15 GDKJ01049513.1:21-2096(+)